MYLEGVDDTSFDQVLVGVGSCVVAVVSLCIALQQLPNNYCTLHTWNHTVLLSGQDIIGHTLGACTKQYNMSIWHPACVQVCPCMLNYKAAHLEVYFTSKGSILQWKSNLRNAWGQ